jgi:hypothetical protein
MKIMILRIATKLWTLEGQLLEWSPESQPRTLSIMENLKEMGAEGQLAPIQQLEVPAAHRPKQIQEIPPIGSKEPQRSSQAAGQGMTTSPLPLALDPMLAQVQTQQLVPVQTQEQQQALQVGELEKSHSQNTSYLTLSSNINEGRPDIPNLNLVSLELSHPSQGTEQCHQHLPTSKLSG